MGKINILWHSMDPMSSQGPGCPILELFNQARWANGRQGTGWLRTPAMTSSRKWKKKKKADEASALHTYIGKSTSDGWQVG
jgi:hypothetical protein